MRLAVVLLALAACKPAPHLEWIDAPAAGDIATLVQGELANSAGHRVIVYVGAKWCEPCQHFHQAAQSGALAQTFPNVRFFAFDLDRDRDRLVAAGYMSPLIPLLVVPDSAGRGTDKRMFGSIKGDGAVAEMTPRLQALLAQPP